jgi:hypothetical protein
MTVPKKQTNQKVTDQMLGTQESRVRTPEFSFQAKVKSKNEWKTKQVVFLEL